MDSSQSTSETVANVVIESNPLVDYPSLLPYEILSHIFVLSSYRHSVKLPYDKRDVPCQVILSQVCSKWRHIALRTSALWSKVVVSQLLPYTHHLLSIYRTWIGRAGNRPLTVTLEFGTSTYGPIRVYNVFRNFVLPFRIEKLDIIELTYQDLTELSQVSALNVEEFAISLRQIWKEESFTAPPFMNKARSICLHGGDYDNSGQFQAMLKELCLPWNQLHSLECHSPSACLSSLLNVLRQAPSLEKCHLTIYDAGSGPLAGISMPSLRCLILELDVHPNIAIPLFEAPNLTTLEVHSFGEWSSDTYDILRKHYRLHQLQQLNLYSRRFPLHIAQVLADAPMVRKLRVGGEAVVDAEAAEGIASGQLGRHLSSLRLRSLFDHAGEWLDMIEARQRYVNTMVTQVSNWKQMITGIRFVEFGEVGNGIAYCDRVAALEALGTIVILEF
ncbi:hypothetical protein AX14_007679 [Amanita brunnescens Koide BX004]|nr:hypothetical protein AX14_007679 [Amanita brunnescens Koide BX004]